MNKFLSLACCLGLYLTPTLQADDSTLKVKVGDAFPNVALKAAQIDKAGLKNKTELAIADLKGKKVVVFFYPKANTRG